MKKPKNKFIRRRSSVRKKGVVLSSGIAAAVMYSSR
jgi:hypothetical protein